jgi:hypothetical protein
MSDASPLTRLLRVPSYELQLSWTAENAAVLCRYYNHYRKITAQPLYLWSILLKDVNHWFWFARIDGLVSMLKSSSRRDRAIFPR